MILVSTFPCIGGETGNEGETKLETGRKRNGIHHRKHGNEAETGKRQNKETKGSKNGALVSMNAATVIATSGEKKICSTMAIETRGRRRAYFYRKKRHGSRVRSIYVGSGPDALRAFNQDLAERKRRQAERDSLRASMAGEVAIERRFATAEKNIMVILRAELEAAGFHQHKGQWRKKRK